MAASAAGACFRAANAAWVPDSISALPALGGPTHACPANACIQIQKHMQKA